MSVCTGSGRAAFAYVSVRLALINIDSANRFSAFSHSPRRIPIDEFSALSHKSKKSHQLHRSRTATNTMPNSPAQKDARHQLEVSQPYVFVPRFPTRRWSPVLSLLLVSEESLVAEDHALLSTGEELTKPRTSLRNISQ